MGNQFNDKGKKHGYWEEVSHRGNIWKGFYENGSEDGIWKCYMNNKLNNLIYYKLGNELYSKCWSVDNIFYYTHSSHNDDLLIHEEEYE